jgi:hypothetical protein
MPRRAGAVLASPAYTGTAHRRGASLSDRLNAMARLVQIGSARAGQEGFDPGLLADAEALLARAGERLRLSAHHTIVVLGGGTGSGKSSLFNQLAGAHFSPVGVLRPVTRSRASSWQAGRSHRPGPAGIQPRRGAGPARRGGAGPDRPVAGDLPDHDLGSPAVTEVSLLVAQADPCGCA